MSKKVVFIHGSPRRKGNTLALAGVAREALAESGIASDVIDAARLEFKHPGCIACHKCQQSPEYGCHIEDELARAVKSLAEYDAVVLATPIYWFSYPAQVKMLIDRVFSLVKFGQNHEFFSPLSGKPWGLLATGGGQLENNLLELEKQWRIPAGLLGCEFVSMLFPACHYEPGKVVEDPAQVARAHAFGLRLAEML
ncbi:MAG: flavodoxin family protein [Acidobacteriota bacterium]